MNDRIEAPERLAKLKSDGVITHVDFEQQKAKILREDAPVASTAGPNGLRERWAEGRAQSRGIRRALRWILGLHLLAIVLVGAYFLGKVDGADVTTPQASSPGPTSATPTFASASETQPDIIVTDKSLKDRPDWNAVSDDPNPLAVCENGTARIANSSSRTLNLQGAVYQTDMNWTIGILKPGEQTDFEVGPREGTMVIADLADGQPITSVWVTKCDASGNSIP